MDYVQSSLKVYIAYIGIDLFAVGLAASVHFNKHI